jgi:hypothetical protein
MLKLFTYRIVCSLLLANLLLTVSLAQVTVSGRRIKVNGVDYRINGVCYNPVAIGSSGGFDFSKIDQDITLMKSANINTIRTYAPIVNTAVLDKFAANGIKVIIGFGYNNNGNYDILSGTFVNYINTYKSHAAILMWELGNEYNYHPEWFSGNIANWYTALNNAAATARANDTNHPVSTAHGELPNDQARNACPNVQVWGMNVYRWDNPGTIYADWAAVSTKPMYLSEAGADSFDKRIPAEDRTAQATAVTNIVNNVVANYSICSGVSVFEFIDEWWKAGSPSVQNTGGTAPNSSGVPYDGSADEEYWGILDINRNAKPAYTALKNAYAKTINTGVTTVYKDCNYGGTAVSLPVGDYTLSQLNAKGILNDDASSLRVTSGYKITLYENDNFGGASLVVTADNACLVSNSWNDRATSIKVAANVAAFSTTIQAESFVSMAGVQTENTTDAGGGLNVGWIDAGDWMVYNVTIPAAGTYKVIYRVASPNAGKTLRLEKDAGATQLGSVAITNTGGWQTWTNVSHNVTLPAGSYSIGIATTTGGFNFNYFTITNNLSARVGDEVIEFADESETLMLSPNPAENELNLGGVKKVSRVKVYDMQGKEKISVENPGSSISVQSLTSGLHIVIVEKQNNKKIKQKFFKK